MHNHSFGVNLTLVCLLSELELTTTVHVLLPLQTFVCAWYSELTTCFYRRLSWGLMYAGFVFILSIAMALIITLSKTVVIVGFLVIVTLFVLYGLSLVSGQHVSLYLLHVSDMWTNDVSSGCWYGIVTNLISCFLYVLREFVDNGSNWLIEMIPKGKKKYQLALFFLPSDSIGFPPERVDKETCPYQFGRVSLHYILGMSGIHCIVQTTSFISGMDLKSF